MNVNYYQFHASKYQKSKSEKETNVDKCEYEGEICRVWLNISQQILIYEELDFLKYVYKIPFKQIY